MTGSSTEINKLLSDIYYEPSHPASLSGVYKLRQAANREYQNYAIAKPLTTTQVSHWLNAQPVYTRHRRAIRKFRRNPIVAFHVDANWQIDLADVRSTSRSNNGVKYILVVIDVLSRHAWTRGLRSKEAHAVRDAFRDIIEKGKRSPMLVTADSGREFTSQHFKKYINEDVGAHLWFTPPGKKASIAERFIQTLKSKIVKYYSSTGGRRRFIDKLQDFTSSYNNSVHRMLKMKPVDVNKENEQQAFNNLYGAFYQRMSVADDPVNLSIATARERKVDRQFKEGDRVRIAVEKNTFQKGYEPRFSKETYTIRKKSKDRPPFILYTLEDHAGHVLDSRKYAQELVPVTRVE